MKKGVTIIHYRDLAKYPPILNLIQFLKEKEFNFSCITSFHNSSINSNKFLNALSYFVFSIKVFFTLIFSNKRSILYFESISAWPIYFYYLIFPSSKKKLLIHYHEYFSNLEYLNQSYFEKYGRKFEKKLFSRAIWISHTNKHRLDLFHKEFPDLDECLLRTMPNYPPFSWIKSPKQSLNENNQKVTKLIYIGAISKGMYLENVLSNFGNNFNFLIHFYSHNFTEDVNNLISSYSNCSIKGSIAYHDIPSLKGLYEVGLVIYNGSSLNFTYNAPNKIFEYLALDLDVWCSDKLITAKDYERLDCYPKMIMVDYDNLEAFNVEKATDKSGLQHAPSPYVCEPVYEKLLSSL